MADAILDYSHREFVLPDSTYPPPDMTYQAWLNEHSLDMRDEPLPPQVKGTGHKIEPYVSCGRWVWDCAACGESYPAPGVDDMVICAICHSGGWRILEYPILRWPIEAELLKQPGYRMAAPLRQWFPHWDMDKLQQRTANANAALTAGADYVRNLSIGTPRTWLVGETLTAANMNTYITEIFKDLIGTNGEIEFENDIAFTDSYGYSIHDAKGVHVSSDTPGDDDGDDGDFWFEVEE